MKKVVFLLAFILTVSSGFSQKRKRMQQANNMSPEQRTTLAVKKLTLTLDLDKSQARKVHNLYSKMAKIRMEKGQKMRKDGMEKREQMMKIKKASKDRADYKERVKKAIKEGKLKKEDLGRRGMKRKVPNFDAQNKALDHMIAMQSEMKKILTKEQYAKYKKMQKHRMKTAKHKIKKHKKAKRMKKSR
jgi:hypothetical protein